MEATVRLVVTVAAIGETVSSVKVGRLEVERGAGRAMEESKGVGVVGRLR